MRIDLTELLRSRPIVHPTRIVATSISRGSLRFAVHGHPWWNSRTVARGEETIEFLFEGITEGDIEIGDFGGLGNDETEALESFKICSLAEFDWAQPSKFSIFCSNALKNPLSLYLRVHDFLIEADAYRRPEEFLNYSSGRLAQFTEIASTASY